MVDVQGSKVIMDLQYYNYLLATLAEYHRALNVAREQALTDRRVMELLDLQSAYIEKPAAGDLAGK